jgi:hypothetical protein
MLHSERWKIKLHQNASRVQNPKFKWNNNITAWHSARIDKISQDTKDRGRFLSFFVVVLEYISKLVDFFSKQT